MAHHPQAVPAPVEAVAPTFGLEAAAKPITSAERWEDGVKWQPEQCAGGGRATIDCGSGPASEAASTPAEASAEPFVVFAGETCSSFGYLARDWNGRARRQLIATRSAQMAEELWTGSLNLAGLALVDATSDILTTAPTTARAALGLLEAGLAHYLQGRQGMIHVTPQLLVELVAETVAKPAGNVYTSPMGHLIVADAGYPGTGPTDAAVDFASQWAYGTAIVGLYLGPVVFNPGTLDASRVLAQAMDRATNDITVVAEQTVLLAVDSCAHVAAQVDLALPAIGGAS